MRNRGTITLVFDDGYQAIYDAIIPLLKKYNVRAVFAIPIHPPQNSIEGEKLAPLADWQHAAKLDGHELAAHSLTHTNLTELADKALIKELQEPSKILSATTLIYPGGAYNDRVVKQSSKYYTAARGVTRGFETIPPRDSMRLKTINFSKRNFSPARANTHALKAFIGDLWLIETYHMVSKKLSPLSHSVLLDEFEAHLDFITSIPIQIKTISDIISS